MTSLKTCAAALRELTFIDCLSGQETYWDRVMRRTSLKHDSHQ